MIGQYSDKCAGRWYCYGVDIAVCLHKTVAAMALGCIIAQITSSKLKHTSMETENLIDMQLVPNICTNEEL
jgi:hypothetical protein